MLKALLDYNSAQNAWLRQNRGKAAMIGLVPAMLTLVFTARMIAKSDQS